MTPQEYATAAQRTVSDKFYGDKVSLAQFRAALASFIRAAVALDLVKKQLFYGKNLPNEVYLKNLNCELAKDRLSLRTDSNGEAIDRFHAMIGICTEAGEIAESLFMTVFNAGLHDQVNSLEENGDLLWYQTLLAGSDGYSLEDAMNRNIAKLRARFPEKFTELDANNRNLEIERKVLDNRES